MVGGWENLLKESENKMQLVMTAVVKGKDGVILINASDSKSYCSQAKGYHVASIEEMRAMDPSALTRVDNPGADQLLGEARLAGEKAATVEAKAGASPAAPEKEPPSPEEDAVDKSSWKKADYVDEGFAAFTVRAADPDASDVNPYKADSRQADWWDQGWNSAHTAAEATQGASS